MTKKTKIVCTIGPASEDVDTLVAMMEAGMDVARLNFSHGTQAEHLVRIKNIRKAEAITGRKIGLMLDTKGTEIRTHKMANNEIYLPLGAEVRIAMTETIGTPEKFSVTHSTLIDEVSIGTKILADDGLITFEVIGFDLEANEIITEVKNAGFLRNNKGINVPNVQLSMPSLTPQDKSDILFGLSQGINFIAPSFIQTAEDVLAITKILEQENAQDVHIIPKIENAEGYKNIKSILKIANGIMVARGDLGVEIPAEEVPIAQKRMIKESNKAGKPVITATQMLESMTNQPFPTRAEANDVANAIFDYSDAVMLSGETAAGKYPVEAVKMMAKIAITAEKALPQMAVKGADFVPDDITETIAKDVSSAAENLNIKTIVATTGSGYTARMISKYRPNADIIAVTFSERIARRMQLQWGVYPVIADSLESTDEMFKYASKVVIDKGFADLGDTIIVTAGVPIGKSGTTNLMKIQKLGDEIVRGKGIGTQFAVGPAIISDELKDEVLEIKAGDILVVNQYIPDEEEIAKNLSGLIIEEASLVNDTVVKGLALDIPIVVAAKNAKKKIKSGEIITLDAKSGIVYRGEVTK